MVAQVEEAAELGADGVSVHMNLGCEGDDSMLAALGQVAREARSLGLPLLAMAYPIGPGLREDSVRDIAHAARVAAELGADLVKVSMPPVPEEIERVVDAVSIPVVVSGGPHLGNSAAVLQGVRDAIRAGASGVAIGRNVFQDPDPRRVAAELHGIVHQAPTGRKHVAAESAGSAAGGTTRPAHREVQEAWFWVEQSISTAALDRACQSGYQVFMVTMDGLEALGKYQLPQRARLAVVVTEREQIPKVLSHPVAGSRLEYLVASDVSALPADGYEGKTGLIEQVDDHDSLMRVVDHLGQVDLVAIRFKDPTNIPLELVLAEAQHTKTKVAKVVDAVSDGVVSLMTMESGADIIVLNTTDLNDITNLAASAADAQRTQLTLKPASVIRVAHSQMGTRVCVDTTSALAQDEGMILGSTSAGGLVTCSETHFLPYMNLRPFRVNAGALHLYIWGPDDRAVYLSDLRAGSQVLAVNAAGHTRAVTVGRVKIERRPLLMIEAEIDGQAVNTFIQDDWHVRMMGAGGEIRPSSEIKPGDQLLGYLDAPGRHVGIRIDETIEEH
jgi:3-dehydroquinate synthase class II